MLFIPPSPSNFENQNLKTEDKVRRKRRNLNGSAPRDACYKVPDMKNENKIAASVVIGKGIYL